MGSPVSVDWPWNHPVRWSDAASAGVSIRMNADKMARASIAEGLDVEGIESLVADLTIAPWLDGLEARGVLQARATRICGVSLEPFEETVDEPIVLRFVPEGSPNAPPPTEGDVELDLDAEDPPDCVAGDAVDVGWYLSEQLALALSPFPRKPGVEFQPPEMSGSISPFAALARLKSASREDGE
jgi:Large ribosomal RNA subunit accumulation protein YceD